MLRAEQKPTEPRAKQIERCQNLYNASAASLTHFTDTPSLDKYIGEALDAAESRLRRGTRLR